MEKNIYKIDLDRTENFFALKVICVNPPKRKGGLTSFYAKEYFPVAQEKVFGIAVKSFDNEPDITHVKEEDTFLAMGSMTVWTNWKTQKQIVSLYLLKAPPVVSGDNIYDIDTDTVRNLIVLKMECITAPVNDKGVTYLYAKLIQQKQAPFVIAVKSVNGKGPDIAHIRKGDSFLAVGRLHVWENYETGKKLLTVTVDKVFDIELKLINGDLTHGRNKDN